MVLSLVHCGLLPGLCNQALEYKLKSLGSIPVCCLRVIVYNLNLLIAKAYRQYRASQPKQLLLPYCKLVDPNVLAIYQMSSHAMLLSSIGRAGGVMMGLASICGAATRRLAASSSSHPSLSSGIHTGTACLQDHKESTCVVHSCLPSPPLTLPVDCIQSCHVCIPLATVPVCCISF